MKCAVLLFFLWIKGGANFQLTTPVHKKRVLIRRVEWYVVASHCETLRVLRNMNFNVPLYDTVLQKLLAGYTN